MRISDWSSDVCSSDLLRVDFLQKFAELRQQPAFGLGVRRRLADSDDAIGIHQREAGGVPQLVPKILVSLAAIARKGVVWGKSVSVRVDFGGRRIIKKKNKKR